MELIDSITFRTSVSAAKENYEEISKIIESKLGESSKTEFMKACDEADYIKANELLDKTVEKMTGSNNVSLALSVFADKFSKQIEGLDEQMGKTHSESEKVKALASHYSEIKKIMG